MSATSTLYRPTHGGYPDVATPDREPMIEMTHAAAKALRRYPNSINALATQFYNALRDHGGFTMDHSGTEPTTGYTVGQVPTITLKPDEQSILFQVIAAFVADHYMEATAYPHMMFGGWRNFETGVIELDFNRWYADADTARQIGKELHRSVYDVAMMDCLVGQYYPCDVCRNDPNINTLVA